MASFSNFVDLLCLKAQTSPERKIYTFLLDGEASEISLTYQTLDKRSRAIAAQLQQNLGNVGSRVLLLYPPGLEFISAFFGCLYAGMVAVPAYLPRRNEKVSRLQAIVSDAQSTIALTTESELAALQEWSTQSPKLAGLRWLATDTVADTLTANWKTPVISGDTLALLQYTSGSTGTPKGVMVSHANLLHNSALIQRCFEHTPNSYGLIWLPPYHDMGLIGGILQPLYGEFPVTLMSPVTFLKKPFRWLQAISRYRATTSGGPDFAYALACRRISPEQRSQLDLSSWSLAFTGAEPIRAQTLEKFADYFAPCGFRKEAFYPCYGMAETTLIATGGVKSDPPIIRRLKPEALEQNQVMYAHKPGDLSRKVVGCGQSASDQALIIVDPQTMTPCQPNRVGEIWISGRSVTQGYWNNSKQTEQTFQAYLSNTGDGPFFRTGDLGFLQDRELFLTGRLKDLIIIQGRNHYPQDIEFTVEQSHPALAPSCGAVFSIEISNQEELVIIHEIVRSYLRKLDASEVIGAIQRAVAQQHNLRAHTILLLKVGGIPKTSSGKVQRRACRDRFLASNLDVIADWSINPRNKTKFVDLEADIESLFQHLQTDQPSVKQETSVVSPVGSQATP